MNSQFKIGYYLDLENAAMVYEKYLTISLNLDFYEGRHE